MGMQIAGPGNMMDMDLAGPALLTLLIVFLKCVMQSGINAISAGTAESNKTSDRLIKHIMSPTVSLNIS